ncbi:MAG: tRNA pseudouridine synthase A [Candidatus Thorarchaeota archaeon]|nr:MAG: tRNA pseudouridine synthase A [Candidatus Thorarchaeota archaeon]
MQSQLVKIFYLGNRYHGSQVQPGFKTVQGELMNALQDWSGNMFPQSSVQFAGRTDRGVHALGQVVRIDSEKLLDVDKINKYLPDDIILWAHTKIHSNFRPRYDVLQRHYRYYIGNTIKIDYSAVQKEIQTLVGTHDFRGLSKPDDTRVTTLTIINACISSKINPLSYDFIGNSFLWKMVRKIVTVLQDIGTESIQSDAISRILKGNKVYPGGIQPAPPESLVLLESVVPYSFEISKYALRRIVRTLNDIFDQLTRTSDTIEFLRREVISFQRHFVLP